MDYINMHPSSLYVFLDILSELEEIYYAESG
jgi:hypothetical protein